jgi:catechol 2,3-dioxygenase-like lactoylglutathione lyase family enzyme
MLSAARYSAALPCRDLDRAKSFYTDKLGLTPADEQEGRLFYQGRSGTEFVLFASSGQTSGSFTQMGFSVADIDAEVRDLKQRGVQFEEYDFPGFDKATSIAQTFDHRAAWFKDSEGNLLVIIQLPVGAAGWSGS